MMNSDFFLCVTQGITTGQLLEVKGFFVLNNVLSIS